LRACIAEEHELGSFKELGCRHSDDNSLRYAGLFKDARSGRRYKEMNAEYIASGIVALLLLVYLIYALLKPERF
jgi:K+-transporting ATPase KdpF subunit